MVQGGGTLLAVLFAALPAKADHTVISGNESKDTKEYIRESANGQDQDGQGGAVYIDGGTLTFLSMGTFKNNTASGEGGAVYNNAGTLSVNNGVIYNNEGKAGGAIYNYMGNVNVNQYADFSQIADDVSVTADWRGAFTTHYRDNTASLSLRFDF